MKPGGRLAIVDIFLAERDLSVAEVAIYNDFNEGWVVPSLLRRSEYESALASAGFINIKYLDMEAYVLPSVRILYRYGLLTAPVNLIRHKLGLTRRNVAAFAQKALFDRRIVTYGGLAAERR